MECSHPVASSTPAVTPPISFLTTSTNISAAHINTGSIKIIIGAAIAAVVLVAIIISSTAIFGAAVYVRLENVAQTKTVAKNEENRANFQGVTVCRESVFYNMTKTNSK